MFDIVLYGRPGCHLCETARDAVLSLQTHFAFAFSERNIDEDEELLNKYVIDIPVVTIDGRFFCRYEVDVEQLRQTLQSLEREHIA